MNNFLLSVSCSAVCFVAGICTTLYQYRDINNLVIECQKELPRNQTCELYAKPKEIK